MKNFNIRTQIFALAGGLVFLLVGLSAIAVLTLSSIGHQNKVSREIGQRLNLVNLIWEDFDQAAIAALRFRNGETGLGAVVMSNIEEIRADSQRIPDVFTNTRYAEPATDVQVTRLMETIAAINGFATVFEQMESANAIVQIRMFQEEMLPLLTQTEDALNAIQYDLAQQSEAVQSSALHEIINAERIQIALAVAAVLLALCAAFFLGRGLSRPIEGLTRAINAVAERQYDTEITGLDRKDEIGAIGKSLLAMRDKLAEADKLAEVERKLSEERSAFFTALSDGLKSLSEGDLSQKLDADRFPGLESADTKVSEDFNRLSQSLVEVMAAVRAGSASVKSGAGEISQVATDLSKRTETQAATLEQSAAALDQLTSSVRSAAEKAAEADRAVSENRAQAEASGEVVREAVLAMEHIQESSSQITQIISVIDDIAFQTNLLALNAGVEAARAGEAGRGFAVVASEVRALAQRASESAREIKDLISKSAAQVEEGGQLVGKTGVALEEIVGRFALVSSLVSDIAVSAKEQATGLQEINTGVNELDQVTQQNAAVVEEATASSEQLNSEAERLTQALARFHLGEAETMEAPQTAAALNEPPATEMRLKRVVNGSDIAPPASLDGGWQDF
ncbi:MAG: methyl-accepting chemotaxis protein [Rhodobacteraceae bacterium]|nr:methyl-accepting chemotaxis protein [Paracoccaceae bacterium]